ncbi:MAG: aspartate 1-decarboxylase [Anaerolineae bacterium CG2_30_64_16]|nr:MAG: aspartate 1-decarboxylase [Anaerolineae bacterium CG2_30_64_16]
MNRTLLFAKIHRATVTAANVHYVGSITVDCDLLKAAGIRPYERVQVVDVDNGARLETYVIAGPAGSGAIELNGAAARLVQVGDKIIIMAYAQVAEPIPEDWAPTVLLMGDGNRIIEVRRAEVAGEMCC